MLTRGLMQQRNCAKIKKEKSIKKIYPTAAPSIEFRYFVTFVRPIINAKYILIESNPEAPSSYIHLLHHKPYINQIKTK